jgi:ABC-type transporter Mla maintaining outer membrane lipid asymmetry ATPase subunit MlaF
MPEVLQPPPKAVTRRDRFREYMKRFNPTASARDAIEAGLVVDGLHQSLYQKLAVRADLEPGSQQLIVGGVGSGKTTQLLLAVDWLRRQGNTIPLDRKRHV